jgi:hypothetical protein
LGGEAESGAKSGALSHDSNPSPPATPEHEARPASPPPDPELSELARAWPTLAHGLRAGILALVRAASPPSTPDAPKGR